MAVQEYVGELVELGPSKEGGLWRIYSYIKIGNDIIKKVSVRATFNQILRDQVQREGVCKLHIMDWFFRPMLIAVTQDDGQTFRMSLSKAYAISGFFILAILLVLFFAFSSGSLTVGVITFCAFLAIPIVPWGLMISKVRTVKADHIY